MTFIVFGSPAPKGSTVAFMGKHGVVTKQDSGGLSAWTQAVGWAARATDVPLAHGAVRVTAVFQFVRPKSEPTRRYVTVRPDVDKITRALLDALTGVAYVDDAQVVSLVIDKVYGVDARTTITVEAVA